MTFVLGSRAKNARIRSAVKAAIGKLGVELMIGYSMTHTPSI
jgi:hypothetical protein